MGNPNFHLIHQSHCKPSSTTNPALSTSPIKNSPLSTGLPISISKRSQCPEQRDNNDVMSRTHKAKENVLKWYDHGKVLSVSLPLPSSSILTPLPVINTTGRAQQHAMNIIGKMDAQVILTTYPIHTPLQLPTFSHHTQTYA